MKFRRQREGPAPEPDRSDGVSAITFYGNWIVNADTKSGFLATGLTVLGAGTFSQMRKFLLSSPFGGTRDIFAGIFIALALLSVSGGAVFLVSALSPRTSAPVGFSRYAFPSIATQPVGFTPVLDAEAQREEAWIQARALSLIALKKFTFFRRGLYAFCLAALMLGIAVLLIR